MTRWTLMIAATLIMGCSQPVDLRFREELDATARDRGNVSLPPVRLDEPRAYRGNRLADPFYPKQK